ncbi:MAG: glycosyltransferase family 2 protein [Clostridia bacterium]|nr:glycosyltransferase family 2 protein [Clostridia bacterium]
MKPLVSIIVGAYNCADAVGKCIESIIAQTYTNWELIICDDCSRDNTLEVLKKYSQQDERIVVISNPQNMRLAATLNNCLGVAKGEYVARMDTDDVCLPERIEKQVDFLENNPEYAVVGSAAKVFDGEKIVGVRIPKENPDLNNLLRGPMFMHPTIMMRKSCYDQLGGYTVAKRTVRGQDWDLWFRFFAAGFKGYNMQEPLIIYHESSSDYKKRTLKTATMYTRTAIYGYRLVKAPIFKYYLAFKPIISAIIPTKLMVFYHKKKAEGKEKSCINE